MDYLSIIEETKSYLKFISDAGIGQIDCSEKSLKITKRWQQKDDKLKDIETESSESDC